MLLSRSNGLDKMTIAFALSLFSGLFGSLLLPLPPVALAIEASPISRWVHTGFYMHKKAYENDRVVLKLLENATFDLNYISYFEDNDDVTWEKNMEATGNYQIRGNDIVFTIEVLVGSEDREKPHYNCPFTLSKKNLILTSCELLNINHKYEFKRSDPDAFHFE